MKPDKEITVRFNKKFYSLKAVKNGIFAYKDLASFNIKNDGGDMKVAIFKIEPEFQNALPDEFCNFVLSEMKNAN
jgi:hypothetical protein